MVALLGTAGLAFMQEDEDIEVEPVISNVGIEIYRPQPISEIWGDFEVDGTANVPGMIAYQLEMIPLNPDGTMPENGTGFRSPNHARTRSSTTGWIQSPQICFRMASMGCAC